MQLRRQAKDIVDDLFDVTSRTGYDIPRVITYSQAVHMNL
jgi:hypothetical protein